MGEVLISATDLAELLSGEVPPAVLDVRFGGPRGERPGGVEVYAAGHIPGSVFVDLDADLSAHGRPDIEGRHPLPDEVDFQATVRRWGLRQGQTVVVHDDFKNFWAGRAWWLLRYAGFEDVRVLDGSLRAWRDAGLGLATGVVEPEPGDAVVRYGALPVLDTAQAAAFDGPLLDSRDAARYAGEEPLDPVGGHIPGALSSPIGQLADEQGRVRSIAELRAHYAALGIEPGAAVGTYCGSGVTASYQALALTVAGFQPELYVGSWSAYSHSGLPVATGPTP